MPTVIAGRVSQKKEIEMTSQSSKREPEECCVCYGAHNITKTPCGHVICKECLDKWLNTPKNPCHPSRGKHNECPMCRAPLTQRPVSNQDRRVQQAAQVPQRTDQNADRLNVHGIQAQYRAGIAQAQRGEQRTHETHDRIETPGIHVPCSAELIAPEAVSEIQEGSKITLFSAFIFLLLLILLGILFL